MRQRDPRPGILGAVDVGRQVATVDRPHTCTPATVGHESRVNPGVAAMARATRDRRPSGLPPPLRVTTEPPIGAYRRDVPKPSAGQPHPEPAATGRHIELRVAGHLSERARGAFGDDRVVCTGSETAIRGVLPDPSHVHEFLARCSSLGLQVISLRQIPQ